ncbi:hypothetical protein EVA_07516 [gut metagenome]|uniref:Uncharacterized protein n=1 Tax=gut metagenome TaxID=749906 RepID=J9GAP2_9ZZZZ
MQTVLFIPAGQTICKQDSRLTTPAKVQNTLKTVFLWNLCILKSFPQKRRQ